LKRIILLTTVGAVVAAVLVASALSVSAQNIGQSPGQYTEQSPGGTAGQPATGQTAICAPWSEEWDLSEGWWYFQMYRWCYDPSSSDPSLEESWYRDGATGGGGTRRTSVPRRAPVR
jgi:hypothetical protein